MENGSVAIVGAGPGNEKLITVRGMELIQSADVIVYDRLGAKGFLHFAKENCEKIDAAKEPNHHTLHQNQINDILIKKAKEGKKVVRLKGGDPFIFGRGGEEAQALSKESIPFEIVSGVSSFYGALAYAGIPVTHRDYVSSLHVFTGHRQKNRELDYKTIVKLEGTLIFLMGMKNLHEIISRLIEEGKEKSTKVAIVQWGTTSKQKMVTGELSNIVSLVKQEKITHPAVIVIGEVVGVQKSIEWVSNRPLFGKRILLTGSGQSGIEAKEYLQECGAEVILFPTIEIDKPINDAGLKTAVGKIKKYTWIFFTSVNAVEYFFDEMKKQRLDIRMLSGVKIFCIGEKTQAAVEKLGIFVDRIPKKYNTKDAARELKEFLTDKDTVLFPASELADTLLEEKARDLGIEFQRVTAYTNRCTKHLNEDIHEEILQNEIDAVGFFSSSQVENFMKITNMQVGYAKLFAIGEMTAKAIKDFEFSVSGEAKKQTGKDLAMIIKNTLLGLV